MPSPKQVCEQLSLIAEGVRAVRSAMETVSIDQSQRRRLKLTSDNDTISVEDLLDWLEYFASEQGPRLVNGTDRFSIHTLIAIAEKLWDFLRLAEAVPIERPPDDSWTSPQVRESLHELQRSMTDLLRQLHRPPVM
jgi:hypothetical protein